jgi:uncharacterized membrane-anchored protein
MWLVFEIFSIFDYHNNENENKFQVRLFNSIAFIGMGTFLILLAIFASQDTSVLAIIFLILSATILGFNTGGFFKSATLIGRQHSHFVNAIVQVSG